MTTPIEQTVLLPEAVRAAEVPQLTVEKPQTRPTPIAYEEVVLTEEAATILEELHQTGIAAPKKSVRRIASDEPPTTKAKNDRE